MNGYIIAFEVDSEETLKTLYWAENNFVDNIERSQFFASIIEARSIAGSLQTQYVDRTVKIISAKNGIYL